MPRYIVVTPLRTGEGAEPIPPGEPVMLNETEGRVLVGLGALTPAGEEADDVAASDGADQAKPLARMNKAELLAEAERVGVTDMAALTNKELIAAIEAKRAGGGA